MDPGDLGLLVGTIAGGLVVSFGDFDTALARVAWKSSRLPVLKDIKQLSAKNWGVVRKAVILSLVDEGVGHVKRWRGPAWATSWILFAIGFLLMMTGSLIDAHTEIINPHGHSLPLSMILTDWLGKGLLFVPATAGTLLRLRVMLLEWRLKHV